jgi:enoyl-CoA hydratase/carnithine racemase
MPLSGVKVSTRGPIAWLEYHRPPINAFDWPMLRSTRDALEDLVAAPAVRVIVVASALPAHFSSGADLRVFQAMRPEEMSEWIDVCHRMVQVMRHSRKPLLACIEGTAVGGGLEITLHCDVRFASRTARLGQPEVNIAFIPPIGATQALARLLGRPRALRLLYEGTLLDAPSALDAGLIDVITEPESIRETVTAYAESLARKPAAALAAIRRCVTIGGSASFDEGLKLEWEAAVGLAAEADFGEGLTAFLEKRPPRWKSHA